MDSKSRLALKRGGNPSKVVFADESWPVSKRGKMPHYYVKSVDSSELRDKTNVWLEKHQIKLQTYIRKTKHGRIYIGEEDGMSPSSITAQVRILHDAAEEKDFDREVEHAEMLGKLGISPEFRGAWKNDLGSYMVGVVVTDLWDHTLDRFASTAITIMSHNSNRIEDPRSFMNQFLSIFNNIMENDVHDILETASKKGIVFRKMSLENFVFRRDDNGKISVSLVDPEELETGADPDFARNYNMARAQFLGRYVTNRFAGTWSGIHLLEDVHYYEIMNEYATKDKFPHFPGADVGFYYSQLGID